MLAGLLLPALLFATGCRSDWRARAISDAEALVRSKVGDPAAVPTRSIHRRWAFWSDLRL